MEGNFWFLSLDGLDDRQRRTLEALIHPANFSSDIEFPWSSNDANENLYPKANLSSLNVHAPAFEVYTSVQQNPVPDVVEQQPCHPPAIPYSNGSYVQNVPLSNEPPFYQGASVPIRTMPPAHHTYTNGQLTINNVFDPRLVYSQPPKPFNGDFYASTQGVQKPVKVSSFNLNPLSKPFMPSNIESIVQPEPVPNSRQNQDEDFAGGVYRANLVVKEGYVPKREVRDASEGFVVKREVSNIKEDPAVKSHERVISSSENNAVKVHQSNLINESSVVNVQESNRVNVQEGNRVNVQEGNRVNVQEGNRVAVQESNEVKSPEDKVKKVSESSLPKVSENKAVKVSKSNNSEATKSGDGFIPEQNSSIEKYAEEVTWNGVKQGLELDKADPAPAKDVEMQEIQPSVVPARRSWADIVSKGQKPNEKTSLLKPVGENEKSTKTTYSDQETEEESVAEDNMALTLGNHLFHLELNYQPVLLQPRGLINRRNWCYINATLQALLACPPFYTLLRNLPLGPGVERVKSSTPVIDSMVKVAYEFLQYDKSQEELQVGQPFQPDFIYDMLRDLKSDCLKGQQEDAEEFLSFILNGMHEEMVKIIKNYEKKNHLDLESETKENGGFSDGEDEWQVIGSKHKGMVTRKVAEHKTPISDLLGGQIKSFLTTSGSKTSASIQPFFTLQLDVQSENVTSVSEALKEMTIKEPIQGYTCAKTKQEVEAFSHIALQKLPPILILHLKRFVYNKNGGCKKVMKKTDYPIMLEINRDIFSPDVKKSQRLRQYKLFAVMYHDGEEAVKGHYISDVYNHGSQTWIRCDDRAITAVTEEQVLSYSPPRVPYLLFYHQES